MTPQPYREDIRYEYDLTPLDFVHDCGGHMGDFADAIFNRYGCFVHVWEPISSHYAICKERFKENDKITVHNCGVGAATTKAIFRVKGNMSGAWADDGELENVEMIDVSRILPAALIKINIEGGEYSVLERLLETGDITRFKAIQVQFHEFPGMEESLAIRRKIILERLSKTHFTRWDYGMAWSSYELIK